MLDTTKRYAVMHKVWFGNEARTVFGMLYFSDFHQAFHVREYMYSTDKAGHRLVSPSNVWAGVAGSIIDNIEVLHEWTDADDRQFKRTHDDLVAYMQGGLFQETLF